MRWAALSIALLFLVPSAVAARTYEHYYAQSLSQGCSSESGIVVNPCVRYFPRAGETNVTATLADVSGRTVQIRICHEWTYDDGSHSDVTCAAACSPRFTSALTFPPSPHNTTYRLFVDLRHGPGGCDVAATAGTLHVKFT